VEIPSKRLTRVNLSSLPAWVQVIGLMIPSDLHSFFLARVGVMMLPWQIPASVDFLPRASGASKPSDEIFRGDVLSSPRAWAKETLKDS
jgi:hypothetical protein